MRTLRPDVLVVTAGDVGVPGGEGSILIERYPDGLFHVAARLNPSDRWGRGTWATGANYMLRGGEPDTLPQDGTMTTIVERLRARTRFDTGDGTAELLEEAAREIERLIVDLDEARQRLACGSAYSSNDWPDDA